MDIILDEDFEKCTADGEEAGLVDLSNFELIAETDTKVFANGNLTFPKGIKAPLEVHAFAEKFHRGQWDVYAYDRRIPDFCAVIHQPTETWYQFLKDVQGCPLEAGVRFKFDLSTQLKIIN